MTENIRELPEGKGWFRITALLLYEGKTFTEIREEAGLSNGTTQRRLEELIDRGWVVVFSEIRDGRAVKVYRLSGSAHSHLNSIDNLAVDDNL